MWTAGHGRSLRPPTPYLAKTDPKNIARAADESALETLLSGSLPRPYHALQHELVPVASRESHWFLPIRFAMVFLLGLPLPHTQASQSAQAAQAAPESSGQLPKMFLLMFFESALTGVATLRGWCPATWISSKQKPWQHASEVMKNLRWKFEVVSILSFYSVQIVLHDNVCLYHLWVLNLCGLFTQFSPPIFKQKWISHVSHLS